MNVELKNIPGALDKDKTIFINGVDVGTVYRGWLRDGGEQWVVSSRTLGSSWGSKTLRDIKRKAAYRFTSKN
tara:strand:+ start:947 stop:1162 length:216 start_codon:yes stop_codon:yes gene_type:complete